MSEVTVAALIEHGKKLAEAALPGGWAASFDECCKVKDAVGTVATLSQTYLRGRRRAAEVEGTARFIAHHEGRQVGGRDETPAPTKMTRRPSSANCRASGSILDYRIAGVTRIVSLREKVA